MLTARINVQLAPGAPPDKVVLTDEEREALAEKAIELGYEHVSTLIREVCAAAAVKRKGKHAGTPWEACRAAADEAGVTLGRWMRETMLAALDIQTPQQEAFDRHKLAAMAHVVDMRKK